ncbi:single-stranded DNA-binding protein [Craterilacuibacter sp. RT1T]|uniref:single-stranded DNA-binding protein n=1 Tax=Craterilacuibacter sp. RT1T TaxID=2942211 RepID=UPI0020BEB8E3|nr:single-stranded DNA-binding protein [Craterilacuibacter sp. RT1T]MCL6262137.1 single-stranded DNA-binding protein [Craterilacuibacter sp. RT1T]
MNSITLDGRVAADSELKYTQSGDAALSFRVASDIGFGEKKTTNWFYCQLWGKRAEALQPYLAKGQQVTVYGQLTLREWTDRDGAKRLSPDVRVNEVSLQGGKREEEQAPPASRQAPTPPPARSSYGGQKPATSRDEYPY